MTLTVLPLASRCFSDKGRHGPKGPSLVYILNCLSTRPSRRHCGKSSLIYSHVIDVIQVESLLAKLKGEVLKSSGKNVEFERIESGSRL